MSFQTKQVRTFTSIKRETGARPVQCRCRKERARRRTCHWETGKACAVQRRPSRKTCLLRIWFYALRATAGSNVKCCEGERAGDVCLRFSVRLSKWLSEPLFLCSGGNCRPAPTAFVEYFTKEWFFVKRLLSILLMIVLLVGAIPALAEHDRRQRRRAARGHDGLLRDGQPDYLQRQLRQDVLQRHLRRALADQHRPTAASRRSS